jgi:hypothetical protein
MTSQDVTAPQSSFPVRERLLAGTLDTSSTTDLAHAVIRLSPSETNTDIIEPRSSFPGRECLLVMPPPSRRVTRSMTSQVS